ncbi:MAG: porin family protein [Dysgonomonas sp.]
MQKKKNLLKLTLTAIALLSVSAVNAQLLSLSVKGGVNFSALNNGFTKKMDTELKTGFHAGLGVDISIPMLFDIQTGLNFTTKGTKFKNSDDLKVNASYLEIPVMIAYKIPILPKIKFVPNIGPYFAYGIGGKTKLHVEDAPAGKMDTFDKALKKFDWGIGGGIGIEVSKFTANLGCQFGLKDLNNRKGESMKTQNIQITVGYKFFGI